MMDSGFFDRPVAELARALIGTTMLVDGVGGAIVETEAYDRDDPASHSFAGPSARNATMFGPPGHAYVYRIYGLHDCLNLTCGDGAAVLIRALAPAVGVAAMSARRGIDRIDQLCAGPGRLCRALAIDRALDGAPLDRAPFAWHARDATPEIIATSRVGIRRGADLPWRFAFAGSRFVSKPRPAG